MSKLSVKIPKYWTGSGYPKISCWWKFLVFFYDDNDNYWDGDVDDTDNDNYHDDDYDDDVDDTQGAGAADCKPARHN